MEGIGRDVRAERDVTEQAGVVRERVVEGDLAVGCGRDEALSGGGTLANCGAVQTFEGSDVLLEGQAAVEVDREGDGEGVLRGACEVKRDVEFDAVGDWGGAKRLVERGQRERHHERENGSAHRGLFRERHTEYRSTFPGHYRCWNATTGRNAWRRKFPILNACGAKRQRDRIARSNSLPNSSAHSLE